MRTLFSQYWQRLLFLSFGHGLNDFVAGYMLGSMLYYDASLTSIAIGFLVYNLLAFGGQYFVALFAGRFSNAKSAITISIIANVVAVVVYPIIPQLSLVLAGSASSIYHVIGGSETANNKKAAPIGLFAAPGILGLVLAGYLTFMRYDLWLISLIACVLFAGVIQLTTFPKIEKKDPLPIHNVIDSHDMLMIFLLGVISLRSAVWNIFQIIYDQNYTWLIAIALSAFVGKILGGWLSDKVGWKLYSLVSLVTAMPLVSFFKDEIALFCIGIGLLQSAVPANTSLMINHCKGQKEQGIALSFGTAVIIGMVLSGGVQFLGYNPFFNTLLFALLLLTLWLIKGRDVFKISPF